MSFVTCTERSRYNGIVSQNNRIVSRYNRIVSRYNRIVSRYNEFALLRFFTATVPLGV
ncbi:hypothetical protein [Nostoc sphaeroides]|uniref:Uncharacterized protein n=1 Tax=Nostoc sphaeroides CCNUC1 TaxID=2653204 RepID=A0A5P8VQB3_9NOSO|nr:hypothetical protein [Nostoc sphaeroides]QFS42615.1 hypothetical protein GXM_00088 [Nostoc sphaeroides CCNUC1]